VQWILVKFKSSEFLLALLIVIVTALLMVTTYVHWINISFFVGPLRFSHLLAIIGTSYIAIATPAFVVLKRYYPQKYRGLLRYHIFGNLLFFSLISIHFASQLGRSVAVYPSLGTGLALYIAMTLEVISGFAERFPLIKQINGKTNQFVHASLVMVFYLVIIFHVLITLGIL
jgi:hypothetical protein